MTLHTAAGRLSPTPPFDFDKSLAFLGGFPPAGDEQTIVPHQLTKAWSVSGRGVVARIGSRGKVESPGLRYTLFAETPIGDDVRDAVADRIRFFLSLDEDLQPFYELGWADPAFAPIVDRLYGYHQVKFATPFAAATWAILSQRTSLAQAHAAKARLVARFGPRLTVDDETYAAFPAPAGVAASDPAALTDPVGHQRKATYLHGVAHAFSQVDEAWLRQGNYDDVEAWLRGIKGIGPWSAGLILIRGLGRMERVDVTQEKRLMDAIRRTYGPYTTPEGAQRIANRYGTWQGYWAHYLRAALAEEMT